MSEEAPVEFDVIRTIGAVTRAVTNRERDGRPARAVVASRDYDTTPDDVWDAITNPERIPRWFLPVTGDLRLGGRYQLQGNASGEITRCEPPRHLALTWEFAGDVSWVTVELTEANGRTHLELEHIAYVDDARWNQYGPGAVGVGWDMTLMGLDLHLGTGAANDPQAFMAWCASPNGKDFIRRSSDGWRRASVEAGTEDGAAHDAALRTTAFYSGEPDPTQKS
jgi:uncharacterized protein YndB with AHSA1/START domain